MYEIVKKENNQAEIKITLNAEEWNAYVEKAYQANKGKFNIQGFRKGNAPRKIIEKNYGEAVFYDDALDMAIGDEYSACLTANADLEVIDQPQVKIDSFDEKGVVVTAIVPLLPEVKLGSYKGLTVEKYTEEVNEAKVEKELNQARERAARFVEAGEGSEAKLGDFTTIDFTGSVNGVEFEGGKAEGYRLELGSKSFIDNFEEQIVGMKVGDERDIKVTFPEDYPSEDLKGKEAIFKIVLHKIENKELPKLDDEFASNTSEFETLEEYKADIRKHLQESVDQRVQRENENRIMEKVVENSTVDIPEVLIERQLDMFVRDFETRLSYQGLKLQDYLGYMKQTEQDLRNSYKDQAVKAVKTRLVLEAVVKAEGLDVTEEELNARLTETAGKYNKSLEEFKQNMNDNNLAYIKNDILMDKLVAFLTKNNTLN
ncbi:MAG: trigger factor [Clostridia bacterium]|nr:trigger factor [Clostridia bacterium]